jgi:hypothetical protein
VRQIVAVVTRDGQPVSTDTVARYRASAPKLPAKPRKVQIHRSGKTVTVRFSASAGASRYAVVARTTTGAPRSGFFKGACRGVVLTGIKKTDAVKVSVAGVRYDSITGKAATASLKARKASGGSPGRALRGRTCR